MKNKDNDNNQDAKFELVLSDGKLRKFNTGEEMYSFTRLARKNWWYEPKVESDKQNSNG